MYDYRQDIINLINHTKESTDSLMQSAIALSIISKLILENEDTSPDLTVIKPKQTNPVKHEPVHKEEQTAHIVTKKIVSPIKVKKPSIVKKVADKKTAIAKQLPPKPIIKKAAPSSILCTVQRELSGSNMIKDGKSVQYFNEKITRKHNLEDGDTVTLSNNTNGMLKIISVKHNNEESQVIEFGPCYVKKDAFGLYVDSNTENKQLSNVNTEKTRYGIDYAEQEKFDLHENDLVTLAFRRDNPEIIKIRWKYPTPKLTHREAKKLLKKKKVKPSQPNDYKPRIKFDLHKQIVTIIAADNSVMNNLAKVVIAHNGTPKFVESKNGGPALRRAKESDYVVLIKSYIKHSISQLLIGAPNRSYGIAMADSSGQLNVEKAIYRAMNNLPVDEVSHIDYPGLD